MVGITDDRDKEKPRKCLRCLKPFLSRNAANRVCSTCAANPQTLAGAHRVFFDIESAAAENRGDDNSDS